MHIMWTGRFRERTVGGSFARFSTEVCRYYFGIGDHLKVARTNKPITVRVNWRQECTRREKEIVGYRMKVGRHDYGLRGGRKLTCLLVKLLLWQQIDVFYRRKSVDQEGLKPVIVCHDCYK